MAEYAQSTQPQAKELPDEPAAFNAAINFAISQGIEAATFLVAWRHGDTSEWPEYENLAAKPVPSSVWVAGSKTSELVFAAKEGADKFVAGFPASVAGGFAVREMPVIGAAKPVPEFASEEVQRFAIDVEKLLCEKLGRKWSPVGMSIQTLVAELAAKPVPDPNQHFATIELRIGSVYGYVGLTETELRNAVSPKGIIGWNVNKMIDTILAGKGVTNE